MRGGTREGANLEKRSARMRKAKRITRLLLKADEKIRFAKCTGKEKRAEDPVSKTDLRWREWYARKVPTMKNEGKVSI